MKFAKKGLKLDQFKNMFQIQKHLHGMEKRKPNRYIENIARTERYFKSSIPSMQRLLNRYERKLKHLFVPNEIYPRDSLVVKI